MYTINQIGARDCQERKKETISSSTPVEHPAEAGPAGATDSPPDASFILAFETGSEILCSV